MISMSLTDQSGAVIPSRPGLDPSRSPAQPPDMVETLRVVGQGSGMEQVDNQDGWYHSLACLTGGASRAPRQLFGPREAGGALLTTSVSTTKWADGILPAKRGGAPPSRHDYRMTQTDKRAGAA